MAYKTRISRNSASKPSTTKPRLLLFLIFIAILGIIAFGIFGWYNSSIKDTPSNAPKGILYFNVEKGNGFGDVGEKLVKQNALKTSWSLPYLMQNRTKWALQPGKYSIVSPASPDEILDQIKVKSDEFQRRNVSKAKTIVEISIKEGETLDDIIKVLKEKEVVDSADMITFAQNPSNFDRTIYPFLPQPLSCKYGDMTNCAKYYPEGYLYPDTYEFYQESDAKDVFAKLLNNFNTKVWSQVKSAASNKDFQKVIIMASVIEKETGRPIDGVDENNLSALNEEKRKIAGVFFNRIEKGMSWGSDPTVSYGSGLNLCQSTLTKQGNCMYLDSPAANNKYNTYVNTGYPIGPISTPQLFTIQAALNPDQNQFLYFVSDASGKKYFSDSGDGHDANVARVKEINKQYR